MKRSVRKLVLTSLLIASSSVCLPAAYADTCGYKYESCCDYDPCKECDGNYAAGVDFLWWKSTYTPTVAGSWSVVTIDSFTQTNTTDITYIEPDFSAGVRAFLAAEECVCDFGLYASYRYINDSTKSTLKAENPSITQGIASFIFPPYAYVSYLDEDTTINSIATKVDLTNQSFDVLLYKNYSVTQCGTLRAFAGLTGLDYQLDVDQNLDASFTVGSTITTPANGDFSLENSFKGLGLRCGFDYTYTFCDSWGINALASGAVFVGNSDSDLVINNVVDITGQTITISSHDKKFVAVPELHLALGLTYDFNTCYFDGQLRLGYETVQWWGLPTLVVNDPFNSISSDSSGNNFGFTSIANVASRSEVIGFHGLFLGAALKF
jgi:hypothetical protein